MALDRVQKSVSSLRKDAVDSPLVFHLIYRLATGGLENGLVNLINHMSKSRYRHVIVCLTDFTDFRNRILRSDVEVIAIHKRSGIDWSAYLKIWKLIKQLRPMIIHTRNLPTMEFAVVAALAGVPFRVHGEHGRDVHDQYGASIKFRIFRKFLSYWIHTFITVSDDLAQWFETCIGVNRRRIKQIYNGVDTQRFFPRKESENAVLPKEFSCSNQFIVGTVGRLQTVKDQATLVHAFLRFRQSMPELSRRVRLVLVGDGSMRDTIEQIIRVEGVTQYIWMAGERHDIQDMLRVFDLFVLPSEAEGISNTVLEAMASGLPVVATDVGGNSELVQHGKTGYLVPPKNPPAMAEAIGKYVKDDELVAQHGRTGRVVVEERFSLESMVDGYTKVYDDLMSSTC